MTGMLQMCITPSNMCARLCMPKFAALATEDTLADAAVDIELDNVHTSSSSIRGAFAFWS